MRLYLHVPFCSSRCGYCDFNTYTAAELGSGVRRDTFADVLARELDLAASVLGPDATPAESVFVGGGTPTLLGARGLAALLDHVRDAFGLAPEAEVTTEANPDSVDAALLESLRAAGYTRVSLGMQSSSSSVLRTLERTHTPGAGEAAARMARAAGFAHVNLDLIYGTPGETDDDVRRSVDAVLDAGVDHVSAYALIVEQGTALARRVASGELPAPDDDVCARRYELIDDALSAEGLKWYEVSNWSRPGGECRHNLGYWHDEDWWGVGPGAHSHVGGRRWWNVRHPATYAARLAEGRSPEESGEEPTPGERAVEQVMLGVRLREGLDLAAVPAPSSAPGLVADGLLDAEALAGGRVVLTRRGRLLADHVVRTLLG